MEFEIGQKIVSPLGTSMIVTKVMSTFIKCEYLGQSSMDKPGWVIYSKSGKAYAKLMKINYLDYHY